MTFITVQFDYKETWGKYKILYEALKKSIEVNCPGAKLHSINVPAPSNPRAFKGLTSNTVKLDYWIKALEELDEEHFIFIDCDMIVLKDMEHVFEKDFDICYTIRDSVFPINGGVVFVKKNERSIDFIKRWQVINDKMYTDRAFHQVWRDKYAGINQAAFGYMIEKDPGEAKLETVHCMQYNCTDEGWGRIGDDCHAIHYKGKLRDAVLRLRPVAENLKRSFAEWNKYGVIPESYKAQIPRAKRKKRPQPIAANNTWSRW